MRRIVTFSFDYGNPDRILLCATAILQLMRERSPRAAGVDFCDRRGEIGRRAPARLAEGVGVQGEVVKRLELVVELDADLPDAPAVGAVAFDSSRA